MKVVSVINFKGGVGKTTLTANLGAYAASKGKRVLLIDTDPQTHLTFNFISVEDWKKNLSKNKTMRDFFKPVLNGKNETRPLSDLIIPTHAGKYNIDILSSHLDLIETDMELAGMVISNTPLLLASTTLKTWSYLRNALNEVRNKYDLVLIDCPPSFYMIVRNVLIASDCCVIPSKLDYLSMLGIYNLQRSIRGLLKKYDEHSKILEENSYSPLYLITLGVIPSMVSYLKGDELISANQEYKHELEKQRYYLFKAIRNNSSVFGIAPKIGLPVVLTQPKTFFQKSQKIIVDELKQLGEDFLQKLNLI